MAGKDIIEVNESEFEEKVLKSETPVLVDFWAEWCAPCRSIAPFLDELATEHKGKVTIAKVNVDDNPNIASNYGIRGIPTLILFKGGEKAEMVVGTDTNKIKSLVEENAG